jgi:hypothetical protein
VYFVVSSLVPKSASENPNLGGTGHWPVLVGYQPAGAFGGKLPPKTGQWPVPPIFQTGAQTGFKRKTGNPSPRIAGPTQTNTKIQSCAIALSSAA